MTKIRNGFTLIEMVITLAIMSILGIAISQLFNSTYRTNTSINDNAEYQADAQNTMQNIQNELKYANSITIDSNAPTDIVSGTKYLYVSGGIPKKNQGALLSDAVPIVSLKTGFTSALTFKKSSSKSVEIIVDILKNGTKVYTLDTNVNLNNLISNSMSGLIQGSSIKYTLPSSTSSTFLVQSINVTSSSSTINTDKGTLQMIANVLPLNATNGTITWSVTNGTGTATIDPNTGILSALTNGTVTASATANDGSGISAFKDITISTIKVTGIVLSTATGSGSVKKNGSTLQMVATVSPNNATNKSVTWSVTNGTGTATIDSSGLLTSKTIGTVTVNAIANDAPYINGTKTITIIN